MKVSIITPFYNSAEFLRETVESIIHQTYKNIEIILINDASTDNTDEIVRSYKDRRIRYIFSDRNLGIASARNLGLESATGELIAFLDHDDISLPERVEKQVELFQKDNDLGLCGTAVSTFGGDQEHIWRYPTDSEFLKARLLFDCPFAASSIMIRSDCVNSEKLRFNHQKQGVDDYEMWVKISKSWKITNLSEVLTYYRIQPHQYSSSQIYKRDLTEMVWGIQSSLLSELGISPTERQKQLHLNIGVGWTFNGDRETIQESGNWLTQLLNANKAKSDYKSTAFKSVLLERWRLIFGAYKGRPIEAWRLYRKTHSYRWGDNYHKKSIDLLLKAIMPFLNKHS